MSNLTDGKLKIAITHGDINGISYEVILKTLSDHRLLEICTPIVYGSPKVAGYHRKTLRIGNFSLNVIRNPDEANPKRANIINCVDDNVRVELGKSTKIAGDAAYSALKRATQDLSNKKVDVLVTAPINKLNMQLSGFEFPGHTEYLVNEFKPEDTGLMLMVGENLRIGVVTGHIPVSEIARNISIEAIVSKLHIMNKSLIEDFAIRKPRIAVLALNPHASDKGTIGNEEEKIIIPAIEQAKAENIMALGPYPADGFFGSSNFNKFDAILAMYHDQGLIPFKTIEFDAGVNYTAGLPVIRTSPAHGTAYEIAGENKASSNAFRQALYLANDIYRNRHKYKESTKDALQAGIYVPNGADE